MWFNVLKNEGRRAAYQDFLSALGLGPDDDLPDTSKFGKIEQYPKDDPPITALTMDIEPDQLNYHLFYSLLTYEMNLIVNNQYRIHEKFIFNLFKEEYPEAYRALQQMFAKEAEVILRERREKGEKMKYQKYLDGGYDITAKDITLTNSNFPQTRDNVLNLLVDSRVYLILRKSYFQHLLRMPMNSPHIDLFTDTLELNNFDTSLSQLVEAIHRVFNHNIGSVLSVIETQTEEDLYLDLIEHLRKKGHLTLKKDITLLIAMKEEYDNDIEFLFD